MFVRFIVSPTAISIVVGENWKLAMVMFFVLVVGVGTDVVVCTVAVGVAAAGTARVV